MPGSPNILYVFTDQQSALALGCMGNPDLRTPAMDRLAIEGVLFEASYCTHPLCTPSRASMFTGRMPRECGAPRNGLPIRPELREQELGRVLASGGYDCFYGGKWHVPEIAMPAGNDHGFHTLCGFGDNVLTEACIAFLQERARISRPRPYFLVASFDNPHNICEWARSMPLPWGDIGEPPPVEECPNLPANFEPAPFEAEIVRVEQAAHWGIYPYRERSPEDWRRLRWAYYRLVEKADREIGRLLDALDTLGLSEDTVVVFSSDHGDGHGAHRWNQKSALFEEIIRVPLMVRAPDGSAGRRDRAHLVSNGLDLFPTICDYAGIAPPAGLRGRSLRPLVEGRSPDVWRDHLVVETLFDGGRGYDTQGRARRPPPPHPPPKHPGPDPPHHIDQETPPGEQVNLAVEARHEDLLEAHRRLLAD